MAKEAKRKPKSKYSRLTKRKPAKRKVRAKETKPRKPYKPRWLTQSEWKPAKPPVKLSKQLAKVRDAIRLERDPPKPASQIPQFVIGDLEGWYTVENKRTGKLVSKHKTFFAAFRARTKALKAERSKIAHELTHGGTPYHNEDPD